MFAFDANVLLGLYRYSRETRNLMQKQLEGLSDRVWLPHQVALEYQRGRLKVIRDQQRGYRDAEGAVEKALQGLKKELKQFEQRHPYIDPKEISTEFEKSADKVKASLKKLRAKHPDFTKKDTIRSKLDKLFKGKVGPPPTQEQREALREDAQTRVDLKIPPGYADIEKDGIRKLGDAIIWLQLLEQAKSTGKPFIFVTDDEKPDWWDQDSSPSVPRQELVQEIREVAGVKFWMYNSLEFIRRSEEFNQVAPEAETNAAIEELEELQMRRRRQDPFGFGTLATAAALTDARTAFLNQVAQLGDVKDARTAFLNQVAQLGDVLDFSALIPSAPNVLPSTPPPYLSDFWRTPYPFPDYLRAQGSPASDEGEPDGEAAESETDAADDTDASPESGDDADQAPD